MMEIQRRITKTYFDFARHKYFPLIRRLSYLIGGNAQQIDELITRGDEELLKCMICYKRSGAFMTLLHYRLSGIFRHLRDMECRAKRVGSMSLSSMINISGPDDNMDTNMMIQEYLQCLNDEERSIVTELFLNEKTMREVSDDCGIVASTICRIKTRAINKMQEKCQVE
ncbi:MAG: sigma-70 family RNA polymerase sigma factor [Candidatus Neomarinimicrobiota bacterium]